MEVCDQQVAFVTVEMALVLGPNFNPRASSLSHHWLVGYFEDLRRFSDISAISRLGSRR